MSESVMLIVQLHQEQKEKLFTWIGLTRVTNTHEDAHKNWMTRWFSHAPGFLPNQYALHPPLYIKDNLFISILQYPHFQQSRFPILIRNELAAEA